MQIWIKVFLGTTFRQVFMGGRPAEDFFALSKVTSTCFETYTVAVVWVSGQLVWQL